MSFQKELLKKKSALKKTEVVTNDKKQEQLIVKDSEDYDRLIKETYFEAWETYCSSLEFHLFALREFDAWI